MLVADILFRTLLRTLKSTPSSQDCVIKFVGLIFFFFFKFVFHQIETSKQIPFFRGVWWKDKNERKKKGNFYYLFYTACWACFILQATSRERHSSPRAAPALPSSRWAALNSPLLTKDFQALQCLQLNQGLRYLQVNLAVQQLILLKLLFKHCRAQRISQ